MADDTPKTLAQRFFRTCLFILGGILALWLALELLAQLWGWLLLAAGVAAFIWAVVWFIRWRRDRQW